MRYKKIVIIAPTQMEMNALDGEMPKGVSVVIGGVGMAETGATVLRVLMGERSEKPDLLILAGIAGAYPESGLAVASCVVVESERVADLGAFRGGVFKPLYTKEYCSPMAESVKTLRKVTGCSVNVCGASFVERGGAEAGDGQTEQGWRAAEVENMEGAAFFALCEEAGVDFLEIRSISNLTTDDRAEWRVEQALSALTEGVKSVIEEARGGDVVSSEKNIG